MASPISRHECRHTKPGDRAVAVGNRVIIIDRRSPVCGKFGDVVEVRSFGARPVQVAFKDLPNYKVLGAFWAHGLRVVPQPMSRQR